ncbi:GNAT family N-acetyltransferase [Sutcliffiella horikoshii]|uniref:GNAT family N-acetyltransferase n=1 Tax=Sutcliffiella horikoshii TaxID=79883 RepID=A0A5D4T7V9_9BACI|nr:GNAT family N-acetyltransferase [Sutcliffiella horikoshii]TYS71733.1 GNAT family N-acetyltransferase [Sutcliffiella horikoshii]
MRIKLRNEKLLEVRAYRKEDFLAINQLNEEEKWNNLVENKENAREAWNHSNIAYVAEINGQLVGYIRGLTDQSITLYICELLIDRNYRGLGIGEILLNYVHDLYPMTRIEMLANSDSRTYYEQKGYRTFYGFRKTFRE